MVVAAIEGHVCGLFGLVDTIRPESKDVVAELGRLGLDVWMVTGDNRRAAHEVNTVLSIHAEGSKTLFSTKHLGKYVVMTKTY